MRAQASMATASFRNHGQVQGDAVAFANAHLLENVSETAHFTMQHVVGVGQNILVFLTLPDDSGLVAAAVLQVAVQTIVGGVELAVLEPLDLWFVEIVFQDLVPFFPAR